MLEVSTNAVRAEVDMLCSFCADAKLVWGESRGQQFSVQPARPPHLTVYDKDTALAQVMQEEQPKSGIQARL